MNLLFCGVKGQVSNVECAGGQQILLLLISASLLLTKALGGAHARGVNRQSRREGCQSHSLASEGTALCQLQTLQQLPRSSSRHKEIKRKTH